MINKIDTDDSVSAGKTDGKDKRYSIKLERAAIDHTIRDLFMYADLN